MQQQCDDIEHQISCHKLSILQSVQETDQLNAEATKVNDEKVTLEYELKQMQEVEVQKDDKTPDIFKKLQQEDPSRFRDVMAVL